MMLVPFRFSDPARKLVGKLIEWLDASGNYLSTDDLKENLDRSWPNYDEPPKWRRFYQHGPVLVPDESSIKDADGNPTGYKIETHSVYRDRKTQAGEIIKSGNGVEYMVQTTGALRRI